MIALRQVVSLEMLHIVIIGFAKFKPCHKKSPPKNKVQVVLQECSFALKPALQMLSLSATKLNHHFHHIIKRASSAILKPKMPLMFIAYLICFWVLTPQLFNRCCSFEYLYTLYRANFQCNIKSQQILNS